MVRRPIEVFGCFLKGLAFRPHNSKFVEFSSENE